LIELSRREREKLSRRNEILQAARKVFAVKGYDVATVDDVANAAELSKGTIYLYFKSKAELFLSTMEMGMKQVISIITDAIAEHNDDPVAGIRDIIHRQLVFCEENLDMFKIVASESFHTEIHSEMNKNSGFKKRTMNEMSNSMEALANYIQKGIGMGVFKNINPKDATFALVSIIRGFSFHWITDPEEVNLREKSESICTIFLDGLIDINTQRN
jgi:AcrR family transcriptional regulator